MFLFWLASGATYRVVSRVFGMSRFTVHRIVHQVTAEVVAIHHKIIHFPKTPEHLEAITRGFARLARHIAFLKAAGAIAASRFGLSHQAALMVIATETDNCFLQLF